MANTKKRCKHCKKYIVATSGMQINGGFFCSFSHATSFAMAKSATDKDKAIKKKNAKQKREFKQSDLKTRKDAAKKACHAYIRARDNGLPCICCGRPINGSVHAGHFLESGNNPQIRYDENNIHAQSSYCNTYKGGNSDDYEGRLRIKIGSDIVDSLLSKKGGTVKRTAQDYLEIESYYKDKLKLVI
jgi:hypothetical protein